NFLAYLSNQMNLPLIKECMQHELLMQQFNSSQLGYVLLKLVNAKYYDEAISLLEKYPTNIDKKWNFTDTFNRALHLAVLEDKPHGQLIRLLHQNNPHIQDKNKEGKTAFLIAAEKNQPEILDIFLEDKAAFEKY